MSVTISDAIMYLFTVTVTITTVRYADISPHTAAGQALASLIMILGYGILAVPNGIVSAENCPKCFKEGHDADATYCKFCCGS